MQGGWCGVILTLDETAVMKPILSVCPKNVCQDIMMENLNLTHIVGSVVLAASALTCSQSHSSYDSQHTQDLNCDIVVVNVANSRYAMCAGMEFQTDLLALYIYIYISYIYLFFPWCTKSMQNWTT